MTAYIGAHTPGIPFTTTRPMTASAGELRYNTTTQRMEVYDGKVWQIADEIYDTKIELHTGNEKFGDCEYWVQANVPGLFSERRYKNLEIEAWVEQTYGPKSDWGYGRWTAADSRYWFKEEKDRDWFVLKWTE